MSFNMALEQPTYREKKKKKKKLATPLMACFFSGNKLRIQFFKNIKKKEIGSEY